MGELLGGELEARGWSQADFAAVLGRPTQFVSEIVTGKKEITRESAAQIGAALSQSAEFWLKLQDQYLLAEQAKNSATQAKLDDVRRRARLNQLAPIQLLQKRRSLWGQPSTTSKPKSWTCSSSSHSTTSRSSRPPPSAPTKAKTSAPSAGMGVACVRKQAPTAAGR